MGELKNTGEFKNEQTGDERQQMKPNVLTSKATANIKHSPTSSKINIEPHNKTYPSQFLLPDKSCLAFQKKKKNPKARKKSKETTQELKLDSDITDF